MDISVYIKELILTNECVILRDVGGFDTKYREAVLDPDRKIMIPPGKIIYFHPDWVKDNGVLEKRLMEALNVDEEMAGRLIEEYVENIHYQLQQSGSVLLEGIGTLSISEENEIQFTALDDETFLADSFGLDTLDFELEPVNEKYKAKIERARKDKKNTSSRKKVHTAWYVILGMLVFAIFITSLWILLPFSTLNLFDELLTDRTEKEEYVTFGDTEKHLQDTITQSIEKSLESQLNAKQALSIDDPDEIVTIADRHTYYIVAGSFRTQERAGVMKDKLEREGFEPIVLVMGENVRVIIGTFDDKPTALKELRRLRNQLDQKIWLLTQ